MKKYLVLDVGGSAIKYAVMDAEKNIYERGKVPTPLDCLDSFVNSVQSLYNTYSDVSGIAMSMPGRIDPNKGYCYTGGALTYIHDINMAELLSERCGVRVTIGNDAKCAANAELGFGSLQDIQDGAVVILGTAIGGALIKDHKVLSGCRFGAGEFSNIVTDYHKPYDGDTSWYASNGINGLLLHIQEALETEENYTGEEIFEMANNGNEAVLKGLNQFCLETAVQIYNINQIFDCEKVAIGGGISAQPLLLELIKKNFDEIYNSCYASTLPPEIVVCEYRNDANLIGALYQHLN